MMKYEIKQSLSDWLLYYYLETFGDIFKNIYFLELFMVFINYHRVYCGAFCSDPLKVLYLKAELTSCALGSVSTHPIKSKIIHFRDHFVLIEHVCNIQFFQHL